MKWQAVIGLEIHVQLKTNTKLFSRVANSFGDEANTNISSICTGQPGTLPLLNDMAVKKALSFGCAIGSEVANRSFFDRKSYFYPDNPRNYQITQYYYPLLTGGSIEFVVDGERKVCFIDRCHLEEDAGMLKHFSGWAGIDLNRAGVPLLEIVTKPCFHTPQEATNLAKDVRLLMQYLDASDGNMEEGSIRFDANVSIKEIEESNFRTKTEIKNMNSFSHLEMALNWEIARQRDVYERGEEIRAATYRFDLQRKQLKMMREKESSDEYRYLPEPDIPPLEVSDEEIAEITASLPELPQQKVIRYSREFSLPIKAIEQLVASKELADYFEQALAVYRAPKSLYRWICTEFMGRSSDFMTKIPARDIARLVKMLEEGSVHGKIAKTIADLMIEEGKSPDQIIEVHEDMKPMYGQEEIVQIASKVIKDNPESVRDYKEGRKKALSHLIGQVMGITQGRASPALINKCILELI